MKRIVESVECLNVYNVDFPDYEQPGEFDNVQWSILEERYGWLHPIISLFRFFTGSTNFVSWCLGLTEGFASVLTSTPDVLGPLVK
jgi:hypothetical protein